MQPAIVRLQETDWNPLVSGRGTWSEEVSSNSSLLFVLPFSPVPSTTSVIVSRAPNCRVRQLYMTVETRHRVLLFVLYERSSVERNSVAARDDREVEEYSMRVARKTGAVSGTRTWEFEEVPLGSLLLPEKM